MITTNCFLKPFPEFCFRSLMVLVIILFHSVAEGAYSWTNTVSGNWSNAANWTNDAGLAEAPGDTGQTNYALNFNRVGTCSATNDLNNGFLLNQLNFGGATVTLLGNSLVLTNSGATQPSINQNSAVTVTISNSLALGASTTMGGSGSGAVTIYGVISGAGSLTKTNSGQLFFASMNAPNTYAGGTTINAGTIRFATGNGAVNLFFGTGPVTVNSSVTLSFDRNYFTNAITFNGGTVSGGNSFSSVLGGAITLAASPTFSFTGGISLTGNMTGPGGIIKTGSITMPVSGTNSFSGPVVVNAGGLSVASFNSVSGGKTTSNLGAPTNAANGTISLGATTASGALTYTGPGETTDRIIQLGGTTGGATITQQGTPAGIPVSQTGQSGLLKFTSNVSIPGTAGQDNRKTLTLTSAESSSGPGFIVGQGEISGNIGDSLLGAVNQLATSVTKAGYGTWTLSGSNTYSGTTSIQAGKLVCTSVASLGSGPLIMADSDVTAQLELDFIGFRQVAAFTNNGVVMPNATYGSSSSIAATRDDVHFAGPGVVVVGPINSPTTNTLQLTSGSSPSAGGAALTFTATVTGGNSPGGSVVFYDGLSPVGTNTLNGSAQASFSTGILAGGTHSITALYLGNASNAPSASVTLSQTVNDTRPATTTTLALTAGANPSSLGTAVTYTATVTGATPSGTVVFCDGTTVIGTGVLNGSRQASLTTSALASGWHGISVQYPGDANNAPSTSATAWQTVKPPVGNGKLKVFILAGQSNMQGKGQVELGRDPNNLYGASIAGGLGTLRCMLNSDTNKYGYLIDTNGYANTTNTTVPGWRTLTNVWVSYFTSGAAPTMTEARKGYLDADFGDGASQGRIGPEYGFGLVAGSQLGDPVLIIKTAWGGTSLVMSQTHMWTPPSSGGTVGDCYTTMVAAVHQTLNNLSSELTNFPYNATNGYEIAGFVWHQGWNDIGVSKLAYETNLANLIRDVRVEFGVPNLPVAIGITGMASASGNQLLICSAQAAVANPVLHPELAGTVFTVDTRPFDYGFLLGVNNQGYHWYFNGQSQFNVGQSMGLGMMSLLASPPGLTNTPATGAMTNSAMLHASVAWPATSCNTLAYWGTANGGTNAAAWTNSAAVGSWSNPARTNSYGISGNTVLAGGSLTLVAVTNLGYAATGLTAGTAYYCTFRATNSVSDLWATNVLMFTTPAGLPSALFSAVPTNGFAPLKVIFTDSSTGSITNRHWSFGDSNLVDTMGQTLVTNLYANPGLYTVTLIASGAGGAVSNVQYGLINVAAVPVPVFVATNALSVNQANGKASLTFVGTNGVSYRLVFKNNMLDALWTPVTPPLPDGWTNGDNGPITLQDPASAGVTQRYYRLEAE